MCTAPNFYVVDANCAWWCIIFNVFFTAVILTSVFFVQDCGALLTMLGSGV